MIGMEMVALEPAASNWAAYRGIWQTLLSAPDARAAFGPALSVGPKGLLMQEGEASAPLGVVLFGAIIVLLVVDAATDPTPFTDATFFVFLILVGVAGFGFGMALLPSASTIPCHRFLIVLGHQHIGVADIHQDTQTAICSLVMGLLPEFRNRKLGSVACRLMLRRAFTVLGARRVESSAFSSNPASLGMHDGMILEGILKARVMIDGVLHDEVLFRLLKAEWEDQVRGRP